MTIRRPYGRGSSPEWLDLNRWPLGRKPEGGAGGWRYSWLASRALLNRCRTRTRLGQVVADQAVGVLVGAALPGGVRVGEVDRDAAGQDEGGVVCHLGAAVPGQGAAQRLGQGEDPVGQGVGGLVRGAALGQGDNQAEPGGPLGQGGDRALAGPADNQVAFPVAGHGPVGRLGAAL